MVGGNWDVDANEAMTESTGTELQEGQCRFGRMRWPASDALVGRSLRLYGEWAQNEIDFLNQFVEYENSATVDVGCGVGNHVIAFARRAFAGMHWACESDPVSFQILQENLRSCGVANVSALSGRFSSNPSAQSASALDHRTLSLAERSDGSIGAGPVAGPLIRVDDLALSNVDFIRINVSGQDFDVLIGATRTIQAFRPTVACSVRRIEDGWPLLDWFRRMHYTSYFASIPAFNPHNHNSVIENVFGTSRFVNLVFVPAERQAPMKVTATRVTEVQSLDQLAALMLTRPRPRSGRGGQNYATRLLTPAQKVFEARAAEFERRLASLQDTIDELERQRAQQNRAAADMKKQLEEQLHEIERLSNQLTSERSSWAKLHTQLREARTEIARLRGTEVRAATLSRLVLEYKDMLAKLHISGLAKTLGMSTELDSWVKVVKRSDLFDHDWYLSQNADVARSERDPIVHYLLFGAFEGRNPNPYFDGAWYLKQYPDVSESGLHPLIHYILYGAKEGRDPGPRFKARAYLEANPDVASSELTPLVHFMRHGRHEGRPLRKRKEIVRTKAPTLEEFERLAAKGVGRSAARIAADKTGIVDVIVPVYRGYDDTLMCIYSVLTAAEPTPFELIVIDDRSPEPALTGALDKLDALGLVTLLKNDTNQGFVATVNRGMALHEDRDVVLLNSDTEVYGNWLQRIMRHAAKERAGTVTPLSNNATLCSYPRTNADNPAQLEISFAELDVLAARINADRSVDLPTAVGFCMYIRRDALKQVGLFDEKTFGKGYGEENDFCMRLLAKGYRNLLAADVFVRHSGEVSFADGANEAQRLGIEALTSRYPTYQMQIDDYFARDPSLSVRRRLDVSRLKQSLGTPKVRLCITHSWGGGIHRHLVDEAVRLRSEQTGIAVMSPVEDLGTKVSINSTAELNLPNLATLDLIEGRDDLIDVLRHLNVNEIEIHSLVGWPADALEIFPTIAKAIGVGYGVMLHDFAPVCPQVNLIDDSGLYCGEKGVAQCRTCLAISPGRPETIHGLHPFKGEPLDIVSWRDAYHKLLAGADWVKAPSPDTVRRFVRYFPDISIAAVPHREQLPAPASQVAVRYNPSDTLRVAIIGAIGPHKGSQVLESLARDAKERALDVEYVVVGYTDRDARLREIGNIRITGRYKEQDIYPILRDQRCHIALLPAVWPETYSYTLSIARAAGYPTVVFDLGAPAERLSGVDEALLLPLELARRPAELNDRLLEFARASVNQVIMASSLEVGASSVRQLVARS